MMTIWLLVMVVLTPSGTLHTRVSGIFETYPQCEKFLEEQNKKLSNTGIVLYTCTTKDIVKPKIIGEQK